MQREKFVMDLRPGDVVGDDEIPGLGNAPFHNGNGEVTHVTHDFLPDNVRVYTVWFVDGSACETTNGALRVPVRS